MQQMSAIYLLNKDYYLKNLQIDAVDSLLLSEVITVIRNVLRLSSFV